MSPAATSETHDGRVPDPGRRDRDGRGRVVGLGFLGAALVLVSAMPTWLDVRFTDAAGSSGGALTGTQAVPGLAPVGAAAAAAAFALTLADGWVRRVTSGILAACGLSVLVLVVLLLVDPVGAASDAAGTSRVGEVAGVSATLVPWLALAGAVVVGLAGLLGLTRGGRWESRPARRATTPTTATHRSDWDALSDGDDPT